MAFNLSSILDIEERENNKVILFTFQSFFIGIFISTFEIGSTSLFLETFSETDLPRAFVISGVVGILFTAFFTGLQKKISFSSLTIVNLLLISALTILLRYSFSISEDPQLIYVVFVLMGPLKVIAFLGFWGMASRIFSLRQGKRLFGLIDSGQVFGAILIGFSTSLIMRVLPSTKDLLIISSFSILITLVLQIVIIGKYKKEITQEKTTDKEAESAKKYNLFRSRYIQFMVVFVVLSTVSVFFIYNSFLTVTKDQFPESRDLTNFLGFFISMVMIFSFLFKTFLYSKLIQMYGLKVVLIILPILLLLITFSASAVGSVFGFTQATSVNFTLFFILIALSQLFSLSLKNSLEVPAFKILYQPLPKHIRYDIQSRIDGIVNELSAVIAGLILVGLSLLNYIELIHFSYALIIILSLWTFVTIRLYSFYKKTLQESLSRGTKSTWSVKGEAKIRLLIKEEIDSESPIKVIRSLQLTANYEPNLFEIFIADLLNNKDENLKQFALQKISEYNLISLRPVLKELIEQSTNEPLVQLIKETVTKLNKADDEFSTGEMLRKLSSSRDFEDRIFAAKILGEISYKDQLLLLTDLIKDHNPKVRKAAISALAKTNHPELWPKLVENLNQRICVQAATSAIISIGEKILPTLEQSFYKSGYTSETMLEIIRVYGVIGGKTSEEYLLKKVNYPDGRIVKQALLSLKSCGYMASPDKRSTIHQSIETTISNTLWNLVALDKLEDSNISPLLIESLKNEVKGNFEFLFLLLSLAYEAESIKYVQENIESGTSEGIGYAIELLDILIAEDLKPKLFPLLEDNSLNEKVRQLEPYFPISEFSEEKIVMQIINRNYNYTDRWTKACAIMAVLNFEKPVVTNDIIANLFNQDNLLRECAAWVIYNINEEIYHECTNRIPGKVKSTLDQGIALKIQNNYPLLYDLTLSLSKAEVFKTVEKSVLSQLANYFKISKSLKNEVILRCEDSDNFNIYFLWNGSVSNIQNEKLDFYVEKGQVFGPLLWDNYSNPDYYFKAEENSTYFVLNEDLLFDFMNQYSSFAHAIYTLVKEGHRQQLV